MRDHQNQYKRIDCTARNPHCRFPFCRTPITVPPNNPTLRLRSLSPPSPTPRPRNRSPTPRPPDPAPPTGQAKFRRPFLVYLLRLPFITNKEDSKKKWYLSSGTRTRSQANYQCNQARKTHEPNHQARKHADGGQLPKGDAKNGLAVFEAFSENMNRGREPNHVKFSVVYDNGAFQHQ